MRMHFGSPRNGRQRIAVALIGMDEVAQTGNRLIVLIEETLVGGAVRGEVLEDGQAVGAVRIDTPEMREV